MPKLDDVSKLLQGVWQSQHVTNFGPLEQKFAQNIRNFLKLKDVLLLSNGHLAIEAMLSTLDSEACKGGEIITTPFTFASTVHAIVNAGFEPVFVDVESHGFGPCPHQVLKALSSKTRAVLGVHVYGVPCQVEALKAICDDSKIALFYDAAHAFGVNHLGRSLISFGDASSVSLHATKIMSSIEGGIVACNSNEFDCDRAKRFRNFGIDGDDIQARATNAKMSEMHAAVGLLNLVDFKSVLKRRLEIASIYDEAFSNVPDFKPLRPSSPNASYYVIQFSGTQKEANKNRSRYIEKAQKLGVFSRPYFSPSLDKTSAFSQYTSGKNFIRSNELSASVLCLPMYSTLTSQEQERVIYAFLSS